MPMTLPTAPTAAAFPRWRRRSRAWRGRWRAWPTGRFCTRINEALPGVAQIKTGAEGVFCGMLPTLGLGIALKMWDGAGRAAEVAMATLLGHLGVLPAA